MAKLAFLGMGVMGFPMAGHLKKAAAAVEVLAMRAQVLGQVIDPGGEQRDLDLGRAGILIVGLVLSDDLGLGGGGGHGFLMELHA